MDYRIPQHLLIALLREGHVIRTPVDGKSMYPLIHPEDVLTVAPATFAQLQLGDVAVYSGGEENPERLTAHRVIKKSSDASQPWMIAGADWDGWFGNACRVYSEQVYGRVIRIERGNRILDLTTGRSRIGAYLRVRGVRLFGYLTAPLRKRLTSLIESSTTHPFAPSETPSQKR